MAWLESLFLQSNHCTLLRLLCVLVFVCPLACLLSLVSHWGTQQSLLSLSGRIPSIMDGSCHSSPQAGVWGMLDRFHGPISHNLLGPSRPISQVCLCGVEGLWCYLCLWLSLRHNGSRPQFSWLESPLLRWCPDQFSTFLEAWLKFVEAVMALDTSSCIVVCLDVRWKENMLQGLPCMVVFMFSAIPHICAFRSLGFLGIQLAINSGWHWLSGIGVCWAGDLEEMH